MADGPLVAIVDDDTSIRNAIGDLLKAAGFTPVAFEDAESFLGSPTRARVACMVADMRMRGMSGLELYEVLAAAGHAVPTAIMTAHPQDSTRLRARAAGIHCYLVKPFAPDELLECVGAMLTAHDGPIPKS